MLNKNKINKIHSLRSDGFSMRKIAKRLKISKDTVLKYIKSESTVKKVQPGLIIRPTEVTGDVTKNSNDIDWPKLFRDEPLGSINVRGMPSSEFPNAYGPLQDFSHNHDDWPPRRRGIRVDQPFMESNDYSESLGYDYHFVRPHMPGIPVPRRKQRTPEKSTLEIMRENNDREQTQKIQSLSKKLDRLDKWEQEKREFEKKLNLIGEQKLAIDQNKKTGSDNSNKISTTNPDNKIGSISHVQEPQSTNHESTYTDKSRPVDDPDGDKTAISDNNMLPIIVAKGFEGIAPVIGSFIGQELYKFKHNNTSLKKVKLIPAHSNNTPKKVYLREAKKEGEIKLTLLDK